MIITLDGWQSKTLLTIDKWGSIIARNSAFDCHLLPVRRQKAIENSVSNVSSYFLSRFVDSINVFDCPLSGVIIQCLRIYNNHQALLSMASSVKLFLLFT